MYALLVLLFPYRLEEVLGKKRHRRRYHSRKRMEHIAQSRKRRSLVRALLFETVARATHIPHRKVVNKKRERARRSVEFVSLVPVSRFADESREPGEYPPVEDILAFPIARGFHRVGITLALVRHFLAVSREHNAVHADILKSKCHRERHCARGRRQEN